MCDILDQFDLNKFKQKISLSTEKCLSYASKDDVSDSDIIFTIGIPHEYFISWSDLKYCGKLGEHSFTGILNAFISQHGIQLNNSERLNGVLRRSCGEISNKYRKLQGRSKSAYLGFIKKLSVYNNDVVKVAEVQNIVAVANKKVELLSKENEELNERCEELWTQIRSTNQALNSQQKDHDSLLSENKALSDYLEKVGIFSNFRNTGKGISELGKKQQHRKLTELKTYVEKSLWFAETFGLTLQSATFFDKSGFNHSILYGSTSEGKRYKDLSEEEKQRIKEILLIVDQFCIGEAAYHEVTMTPAGENLPRSYLVKECKESLNALTHIERTPGVSEGAQLIFIDALSNEIQKHVSFSKLPLITCTGNNCFCKNLSFI